MAQNQIPPGLGFRVGGREGGCYSFILRRLLVSADPVYIENVHHFVEEAMRHANR
jgi:hypothetical protein